MLTRSIISVIQSQFHQLHVLCSTMEPKNSESSIRRMQNFGNLVIMHRSRFFFPKGGVGVGPRDSLICQERGVWGSEVFHRPLYHFEFTRGGGRVRTYIEPPSRYAHINYRQFEKAIFWIPFFFFGLLSSHCPRSDYQWQGRSTQQTNPIGNRAQSVRDIIYSRR